MVNDLKKIAAQLASNPECEIFSGTGLQMPTEFEQSQNVVRLLAPSMWPTANKIQQMLIDRFQAKKAMSSAWGNLDPSHRDGLKEPLV